MEEDPNSCPLRSFVCSCGKDYLSYAALFTHIKQKHDGKVVMLIKLGTRAHRKTEVWTQEGKAPQDSLC